MRTKCKLYFAFFLAIIATIVSFSFSIPAFAEEDNGYLIVYVTESGGKYHSEDCGYLRKSKYSITLENAIREGYTRCTRCDPPIYTGTIEPIETKEVRSGGSGSRSTTKSLETEEEQESEKFYKETRRENNVTIKRSKPKVAFGDILDRIWIAIVGLVLAANICFVAYYFLIGIVEYKIDKENERVGIEMKFNIWSIPAIIPAVLFLPVPWWAAALIAAAAYAVHSCTLRLGSIVAIALNICAAVFAIGYLPKWYAIAYLVLCAAILFVETASIIKFSKGK